MSLPEIALPGAYLAPASEYLPGPGTHIHDSHIYASIAGPVVTSSPPTKRPAQSSAAPFAKPSTPAPSSSHNTKPSSSKPSIPSLPLLSVSHSASHSSSDSPLLSASNAGVLGIGTGGGANILPEVESVVLARVTRLGPKFATLEILVVGETVCREGFQGVVRKEDVRATEKDRVRIEKAFRVGDLVRGMVISLGDQSNYYLSTAQNEYGVVMATSEAGNQMYPISWKEFRDPKTGKTEARKVAKPF